MKAVVAASQHWMDGEVIRECLVELPISSTVVVSSRSGGDTLVAKIAEEELALHVERFDIQGGERSSLRSSLIEELENDVDAAFFFCNDDAEEEYFVSKYSRTQRIPTEVVIKKFGGM